MAAPHSSMPDPEMQRLMDQFRNMKERRATRKWPDGRISGDDDGETVFKIGSDPEKELVRIEFPTPTEWLAMPPQDAIKMAQLLIQHARAISKEPIRISLH